MERVTQKKSGREKRGGPKVAGKNILGETRKSLSEREKTIGDGGGANRKETRSNTCKPISFGTMEYAALSVLHDGLNSAGGWRHFSTQGTEAKRGKL